MLKGTSDYWRENNITPPTQHNTTSFTTDNQECIYACKTVHVFLQFDTDVKTL